MKEENAQKRSPLVVPWFYPCMFCIVIIVGMICIAGIAVLVGIGFWYFFAPNPRYIAINRFNSKVDKWTTDQEAIMNLVDPTKFTNNKGSSTRDCECVTNSFIQDDKIGFDAKEFRCACISTTKNYGSVVFDKDASALSFGFTDVDGSDTKTFSIKPFHEQEIVVSNISDCTNNGGVVKDDKCKAYLILDRVCVTIDANLKPPKFAKYQTSDEEIGCYWNGQPQYYRFEDPTLIGPSWTPNLEVRIEVRSTSDPEVEYFRVTQPQDDVYQKSFGSFNDQYWNVVFWWGMGGLALVLFIVFAIVCCVICILNTFIKCFNSDECQNNSCMKCMKNCGLCLSCAREMWDCCCCCCPSSSGSYRGRRKESLLS